VLVVVGGGVVWLRGRQEQKRVWENQPAAGLGRSVAEGVAVDGVLGTTPCPEPGGRGGELQG
jgi:hypothetical protein